MYDQCLNSRGVFGLGEFLELDSTRCSRYVGRSSLVGLRLTVSETRFRSASNNFDIDKSRALMILVA